MDKSSIPKRLDDYADDFATPRKKASAWMNEFREARRAGKLMIVTKDGKKGGNLYTTDYYMRKYLSTHYLLERSAYAVG